MSDLISSIESGVSVNGEGFPARDGEIGVLKVSSVSYGRFDPSANKSVTQADLNRVKISPLKGHILMSRCNTPALVGASVFLENNFPDLFLSDKLWQLIPKTNAHFSARWLAYFLAFKPTRLRLAECATGSSLSMKNIVQDDLQALPVLIPPVREQEGIVSILQAWDREITQIDDLIDAKVRYKEGFLLHFLTGKRRFPEFLKERRRERYLGEFLSESRIRGSDGATARKLTIKLYGRGVVPKTEKIAGSAATQYFLRKRGQFIYSKLDFLNGAFCVVPDALDGYETTADLPAFDVEGSLNPRWLLAYVCREEFYRRKLGLAAGGRKARRVNPDAFLRIKIPVPSRAEQDKIVEFLDALDREIGLLTRLVDALSRQKKALMQKLLTGQIRVKV